MDHALERLVGELDRELILVVFAGADAGLDGAVFGLRVNVDEGRKRRDALSDLIFEEDGEAAVEIFFRRFALQTVKRVPFLLKRAGAAHLKHVGRKGVSAVGVRMGVDPAAGGLDRGLDHVADRQRGVVSRGH